MIQKTTILVLIFVSFAVTATSQVDYLAVNTRAEANVTPAATPSKIVFSFLAMSQATYTKDITDDMAGKHFLGVNIAKKVYSLNKMYCYKEPVAPGTSATKTIFRKPEIYHSVKKIENLLKDMIKRGELSPDAAREKYDKVLDVALNILDEDTKSFESRLSAVKGKADQLLAIYIDEVELKKIN